MDLTATTIGDYTFKPIGYDDDNNLACTIENKEGDTIIQATYDFNQERFNINPKYWKQKRKEEVTSLLQQLAEELELT